MAPDGVAREDIGCCAGGSSNDRRGSSDCGAASCISSDGCCGASRIDNNNKCANDSWCTVPSANAADTSARYLQLGNIVHDADKQALEQLLEWFGPLESVHVIPDSNLAVAAYLAPQHAAAAKAALGGCVLPCVTGDLPLLVLCREPQQQPFTPTQLQHSIVLQAQGADASDQHAAYNTIQGNMENGDLAALLSSFRALGLPVPEEPPSRHLFVAYVVQNLGEHALVLTFAPYGVLESVRTLPGMHYAFVNYRDVQSAIYAKAALQGHIIPAVTGNKPMQMRFKHRANAAAHLSPIPQQDAQHQPLLPPQQHYLYNGSAPPSGAAGGGAFLYWGAKGGETQGSSAFGAGGLAHRDNWESAASASALEGRPARRLWVGNIPADVGQEDVTLLFAPFGPLESVRVFPDRNFAFVNYVWPQDAAAARLALNDRMVLAWKCIRALLVRYPRDREPCNGHNQVEYARGSVLPSIQPSIQPLNGDANYAREPVPRPRDKFEANAYHHSHVLGGRYLPMNVNEGTYVGRVGIAPGAGLQQLGPGTQPQRQSAWMLQELAVGLPLPLPIAAEGLAGQLDQRVPATLDGAGCATAMPHATLSPSMLHLLWAQMQGSLPASTPAGAAYLPMTSAPDVLKALEQDAYAGLLQAWSGLPANAPPFGGQGPMLAMASGQHMHGSGSHFELAEFYRQLLGSELCT